MSYSDCSSFLMRRVQKQNECENLRLQHQLKILEKHSRIAELNNIRMIKHLKRSISELRLNIRENKAKTARLRMSNELKYDIESTQRFSLPRDSRLSLHMDSSRLSLHRDSSRLSLHRESSRRSLHGESSNLSVLGGTLKHQVNESMSVKPSHRAKPFVMMMNDEVDIATVYHVERKQTFPSLIKNK